MQVVDNFRLCLGTKEYVPIVIGGMGVDISTQELALEAARLGGIGHISDAMALHVSDKRYKSDYTQQKERENHEHRDTPDKSLVRFNLDHLREAQLNHVRGVMEKKRGPGGVFINVIEKLTMGDPLGTLKARLTAALDGGIDGITLSAGLHTNSLKLIEDHPRFRDAKIGIIVSSSRALRIFLRGAQRCDRLPDYIVVEGPLAGGHLGFGEDWQQFSLRDIVIDVLNELKTAGLNIPVIPAGGVFTGTDAAEYLELGAGAVQVATRFTVTKECGLPFSAKQKYFQAREEDVVVSQVSPTGYLIRLLTTSPCLDSRVRPNCEAFGYVLSKEGKCLYIDAYEQTASDEKGRKLPVKDKICLCYHFSKYNCYTCGHYVYRLKDTSLRNEDGTYELLTAEHVFRDYQFSRDHQILLPSRQVPLAASGR